MLSEERDRTVVSAPGKVLITGGYLILDQGYEGYVLTGNARFFAVLTGDKEKQPKSMLIEVISPQFENGYWAYSFNWDRCPKLVQKVGFVNHYIQVTLNCTLIAIFLILEHLKRQLVLPNLQIYIIGSNDFYSQTHKVSGPIKEQAPSTVKQSAPRFTKLGIRLEDVCKTGLGSSATLVTSLVGALVKRSLFDSNDEPSPKEPIDQLNLIHNLAQLCHCMAQGKIGSGFDVSAAVFGSQLYRRFDPSLIRPVLAYDWQDNVPPSELLVEVLKSHWEISRKPCRTPPLFKLMLAEVNSGSHTPSMVRKVQKWKTNNTLMAGQLWNRLSQANSLINSNFGKLYEEYCTNSENYLKGVNDWWHNRCAGKEYTEEDPSNEKQTVCSLLEDISLAAKELRFHIGELGRLAGVPIQPEILKPLLDQCAEIRGVLMVGIPGAGGFDALYCIALDREEVRNQVEEAWLNHKPLNAIPLDTEEEPRGIQFHSETLPELAELCFH